MTDGERSASPSWRFLFEHPAHFFALGLGSGLSPVAPGTAGTLFAWFCYPWLRSQFSELGFLQFLLAAFLLGVYACDKTGRDLGVPDHGAMVWDEMLPFWLILLLCPADPWWQFAAFLLFRGFDIFKPPPIRRLDRSLKNGLGVMLDDLLAAAYTLLVLAIAKLLWG